MMVPLTTVAQGSGSGIATPRRTVVRDAGSWRALWAAHAGPDASAPAIDFASRMVAAAFAGERPAPGHAIEIADARVEGTILTLSVRESVPPRDMASAQVLVSPFHIATLPRFDGDVRFADGSATPGGGGAVPISPSPSAQVGHASAAPAPVANAGATPSSTGLEPNFAAALAYLAGPFSGILILLVERTSEYVRFHAWQSVLGLGGLGVLAAATLVFSFLTLLLSPLAFTVMYRLSEIAAVVWVVGWVGCLVMAFTGRLWKMPVAGRYAERLATRPMPPVR
jgi:uncharacterized membrane protein